MRVHTRTTVAALSAVAVVLPFTTQAAQAADGARAAVADAQPSWVSAAKPTGDAAGSDKITLRLYLALRDQAGLEKSVQSVSTPGTAQYGKYLTAQQFRARYAPTDATVAQVRGFLAGSGLTVTETPANRRYIAASGTVDAVEKAFGTSLKIFSKDGESVRAAATPTTVPSALAGKVIAVSGLASRSRSMAPRHTTGGDAASTKQRTTLKAPKHSPAAPPPDAFVNARPCSAYFGEKLATGTPKAFGKTQPYAPCGYTPAQLQGAYGLTRSVAKGFDGRGVTVAITDAYAAPTILSDANTYATKHGQAPFRAHQFSQVLPKDGFIHGYDDTSADGDSCGEQGWYGEETLDVEAVHAVAPRADVVYVASRSCDDADFLDALNKIVDNHLADIVSNSWGSLGENTPPELLKVYQQTFFQAALEGIGFYFSSGDDGDDSASTEDGQAAVDFPAADPLVTAVGGTSLSVNAKNRRDWETGWGTGKSTLTDGAWDPAAPAFVYGAGGGTSQVFSQPFYQKGVVPNSIAKRYGTPGRAVPDIAAVGDPSTGMLVGETQTFADGTEKYSEYRIGGTSLASPLMAGIMAIADQVYGRPHGFANPAIYALAGSKSVHDPAGNPPTRAVVRVDYVNGQTDSDGLRTTLRTLNQTQSIKVRHGYDDVTGIGTPNGESFLSSIGYAD